MRPSLTAAGTRDALQDRQLSAQGLARRLTRPSEAEQFEQPIDETLQSPAAACGFDVLVLGAKNSSVSSPIASGKARFLCWRTSSPS